MKQAEIEIGAVYQVKVSGKLKPVRIESRNDVVIPKLRERVRFSGTVLTTGRKITLTAGRMRKQIDHAYFKQPRESL